MSRARTAAGALLVLAALCGGAGRIHAQTTLSMWVDLVQMPVAVTRLELAGVPVAGLRLLVPALNQPSVRPRLFLEAVRGISILDFGSWDGATRAGMGGYVRSLHERGLRGPALASAIHRELRRRGVPSGPKASAPDAHDVFGPGYVPVHASRVRAQAGVARGQRREAEVDGRGAVQSSARPHLTPRGEGRGRGPAPRSEREARPRPQGDNGGELQRGRAGGLQRGGGKR